MTPAERNLFLTLADSLLQAQELQTGFARLVIGEFQKLKAVEKLRASLDQMPAGDESDGLRAELARLEFEYDSEIAFEELNPLLSKSAAELALLRTLLVKLPDGIGHPPESPAA